MEKKKIKIIYCVIAIVIVAVGFFTIKWLKEANQENEAIVGDEYTPEAEISEEQARQTIVTLYFQNKETKTLTTEARLVDIKDLMNTPYEKLMNLLIEGPKNESLEGIIPEGTKVLKTYIEEDSLVLDLTKDFLNFDMEEEKGKDNLINSIVCTMTELTEVNSVKFLIEGQESEVFNEVYTRKAE